MKSMYYEQIDYLDHDLMEYVRFRKAVRLGLQLAVAVLVTGIISLGLFILSEEVHKNATHPKTSPYVSQRPGGEQQAPELPSF